MKNVYLSSRITVNNLPANKILQTEELDKKLAPAFATDRFVEKGPLNLIKLCQKMEIKMKFNEGLPKTKLP